MPPYFVKGKSIEELLDDLEAGEIAATAKGSTMDLVQAASAARAAQAQIRWAIVAAASAAVSVLVAIAAVIVAVAR